MSTLKEILREAGLDEEQISAVMEQAESEKTDAISQAVEKAMEDHMTYEDYEEAKEHELEARAHEADCIALYGDYAEERAGVAYFGKGDVHKNEDGEILSWD